MPGTKLTLDTATTATSSVVTVYGGYSVSIKGNFDGTIKLQRDIEGDGVYNDISAFSSSVAELVGTEPYTSASYRFFASRMVSGTATCTLAQDADEFNRYGGDTGKLTIKR